VEHTGGIDLTILKHYRSEAVIASQLIKGQR
jgi:hypothetical protein